MGRQGEQKNVDAMKEMTLAGRSMDRSREEERRGKVEHGVKRKLRSVRGQ